MSDTKHTAEPTINGQTFDDWWDSIEDEYEWPSLSQTNVARLTWMHACAGMAKPAAEIELLRAQVKAAPAASVENEKAAARCYVTPQGESFSEGECIAALAARIERLTVQVEMGRDREHRLRTQLDEWREERRLGEKDEGRHRDTHQAEHWPDFADLPINNNVPRARQHISACCDSVLMQGVDYVRAERCVNACVGIKDPAAFVRAAEGLYWLLAVRSDLGTAAMKAALRSYMEARGNYPIIPPAPPATPATPATPAPPAPPGGDAAAAGGCGPAK